jgi:hypothetical protein
MGSDVRESLSFFLTKKYELVDWYWILLDQKIWTELTRPYPRDRSIRNQSPVSVIVGPVYPVWVGRMFFVQR